MICAIHIKLATHLPDADGKRNCYQNGDPSWYIFGNSFGIQSPCWIPVDTRQNLGLAFLISFNYFGCHKTNLSKKLDYQLRGIQGYAEFLRGWYRYVIKTFEVKGALHLSFDGIIPVTARSDKPKKQLKSGGYVWRLFFRGVFGY